MISPDVAARVGGATVDAATKAELEMIAEAAAALAYSDGNVAKQANELLAKLRKINDRYRDDMSAAMLTDLTRLFMANAADECKRTGARGQLLNVIRERAEEKAKESAAKVDYQFRSIPDNMAMSAKNLFLQESTRAFLEVDAGLKTKDKAIRDATARMAKQGLYANTYTDKNGRQYNVPVDVGVRSLIQDEALGRLTEQTLEIAEFTGSNLVEVSSHIGARPTHAEWHGRVYQLKGSSKKYRNFFEACHVGDPVAGYGGYNCKHTIGIYTEGMPHRYDPHPEKGTGYTNNEVYELRQKQRRLENDIRHLKRQRDVIEAQGFDTKDIDARIRHKQAALRELIADNDTVLQRDRWREQVASVAPAKHVEADSNLKDLYDKAIANKERFSTAAKRASGIEARRLSDKAFEAHLEAMRLERQLNGIAPTQGEIAGVAKADPISVREAVSIVNPDYEYNEPTGRNCQACVVAVEAQLKGFNVEALPNTPGSMAEFLASKWWKAWRYADGSLIAKPDVISFIGFSDGMTPYYASELSHVSELYETIDGIVGDNERYVFSFEYRNDDYAHIINVLRLDGDLALVDGQSSKLLEYEDEILSYLKRVNTDTIEMLRVDDKMFDEDVAGAVLRRSRYAR